MINELRQIGHKFRVRTQAVLAIGSNDEFDLTYDGSNDELHINHQSGSTVTVESDGSIVVQGGPNGNGEVSFGSTRLYENGSGEVVVEDSGGATTVLS